jgi:hypothetical protein
MEESAAMLQALRDALKELAKNADYIGAYGEWITGDMGLLMDELLLDLIANNDEFLSVFLPLFWENMEFVNEYLTEMAKKYGTAACELYKMHLEADSGVAVRLAVPEHNVLQLFPGMIRFDIHTRLRSRSFGVRKNAVLDQQVLDREHGHPLPVIAVTHAIANRDIRAAHSYAVTAGLKHPQILHQNVLAPFRSPECIPPLAVLIRRLLIVAFPHPQRRTFAAAQDDIGNRRQFQEIVAFAAELAALGHKLHARLENEFDVRRHFERQCIPRSRLTVENHLLRTRRKSLPDEFGGILAAVAEARDLDCFRHPGNQHMTHRNRCKNRRAAHGQNRLSHFSSLPPYQRITIIVPRIQPPLNISTVPPDEANSRLTDSPALAILYS